MTTRDELTVLPPAEFPDPKGLRVLNQYLHAGWADPGERAVVFVLQMPAPPGPPKLVGPGGEEHVLPGEVFEVLWEVVSAMAEGKAVTATDAIRGRAGRMRPASWPPRGRSAASRSRGTSPRTRPTNAYASPSATSERIRRIDDVLVVR